MAVKKTTKTNKDQQMFDVMQQMMVLMGKLLEQNTEHSKMQQEWLRLFRPPTQPVPSTTFDERQQLKDEKSLWTEVDAQQMMKEMVAELGIGSSNDDDGVM